MKFPEQELGVNQPFRAVHPAHLSDLDMNRFTDFLTMRKAGAPEKISTKTTDEALCAYHIITEEHSHLYPTVAGILLFGKEPQHFLPEAFIICSHFAGVAGREALLLGIAREL